LAIATFIILPMGGIFPDFLVQSTDFMKTDGTLNMGR
jgi:hypothetical protein|tara:strand:- start:1264 stop:1374 length:111 start_codon:yes stop_codon:yes gene_type:complete